MSKTGRVVHNLRHLTDDDLAGLYGSSTQDVQSAVRREANRRDRKEKQTKRDKARWAAVYAEWLDWAHAQFVTAEAQCRGYLLNSAGLAAGLDPWDLWRGPHSHATRYASEELIEFWQDSPRVTVSQYRAMQRRDSVSR